jgi:hypothetical protein
MGRLHAARLAVLQIEAEAAAAVVAAVAAAAVEPKYSELGD